ncbi:extracellular solute-binding protein [Variovorax sp. UC122_21]|uniref:extracellular solute-binding protein n=1 Tax=Variovorax sp. UC122_21 TaxID=3374554 RepID=UPI003757CC26
MLDLSPYLARDEAFRARFLPRAFDATTFDGKVYGLPGEETSAAVVFYNAELFRRHGLKPPRTWPELMALVGTLKRLGIAPFALANKSKWPGSMYFMYLVDRIGGPDTFRKAAARTGGEGFAAPAFVEAGRYLQELVKAGAFAPGFNGLDHDTGASRRLLYAGKAAMTLMGSWELGNMQNENPAFRKKVDFFPFPTVPNGKGASDAVIGSIGTNFYSISSACKSPEAAYALIKTMVDDEAVRAPAGQQPHGAGQGAEGRRSAAAAVDEHGRERAVGAALVRPGTAAAARRAAQGHGAGAVRSFDDARAGRAQNGGAGGADAALSAGP